MPGTRAIAREVDGTSSDWFQPWLALCPSSAGLGLHNLGDVSGGPPEDEFPINFLLGWHVRPDPNDGEPLPPPASGQQSRGFARADVHTSPVVHAGEACVERAVQRNLSVTGSNDGKPLGCPNLW